MPVDAGPDVHEFEELLLLGASLVGVGEFGSCDPNFDKFRFVAEFCANHRRGAHQGAMTTNGVRAHLLLVPRDPGERVSEVFVIHFSELAPDVGCVNTNVLIPCRRVVPVEEVPGDIVWATRA